MSFQAMTWAQAQRVGSPIGKAILLTLANYADGDGRCFPGQVRLADDCECSERSVREWLGKLEELGLIHRDRRKRDDGLRTSDAILLLIDPAAAATARAASQALPHAASQAATAPAGAPAAEGDDVGPADEDEDTAGEGQPADAAAGSPEGAAGVELPAADAGNGLAAAPASEELPAAGAKPTGSSCRGTCKDNHQISVRERERAIRAEFEATFWPAYPNKVGKPDAAAKFAKARQSVDLETIMAGLERYVQTKPADRRYCNPSTWLNQHRWADQPAPDPEPSGRSGPGGQTRHAAPPAPSRPASLKANIQQALRNLGNDQRPPPPRSADDYGSSRTIDGDFTPVGSGRRRS